MAEADLDAVIRQIAKAQNKSLMAAVKKRRDQIMARAAKAKDKPGRDQLRAVARSTLELGTAAARRLQNSAEIAADAYARAVRHAAEEAAKNTAAKPAKKDGGKGAGKKAAKG
jgi:non-ribosomal peptide synthetase component F